MPMIEISFGELADRMTILQVKEVEISDKDKLERVRGELDYLLSVYCKTGVWFSDDLLQKMHNANLSVWKVLERQREKEHNHEWDAEFIQLSREVYILNDLRYEVKKEISSAYGSLHMEQKSYV